MGQILFRFFLILNIVPYLFTKKIKIPFKTSHNTNIDYIKSLLYGHIYTQLMVSTTKQIVNLGISTEESLFAIESSIINENNYNINKSTSYRDNRGMFIYMDKYQRYFRGDILNETFYMYNSPNYKEDDISEYNDLMFAHIIELKKGFNPMDNGFIDNNKNLISGKIGLQITNEYNANDHISLIKDFKSLNLIDKLVWTLIYTTDEEGYLTFGEYPYQYNNSYNEEMQQKISCLSINNDFSWTFSFTDIKIGKQKLTIYRLADYSPQLGLIKGTSEYLAIIKPYFESLGKCKLIEIEFKNEKYEYYECEKNTNINNFEPLIFVHQELENNFVLTKDDLFIDYNEKKYFLILFPKGAYQQRWQLGKPFTKKYKFSFDHESRNILFYKDLKQIEEKNDEPKIKIIIIIIGSIIGIVALIGGIYIGKKFCSQKKKKKANKLEDEIINNKINNENNEDSDKLGIN